MLRWFHRRHRPAAQPAASPERALESEFSYLSESVAYTAFLANASEGDAISFRAFLNRPRIPDGESRRS